MARYGYRNRPQFNDPRSALSARGARVFPCPTCKEPNKLTAADRARGYQCDACADRDEGRCFGMEG